MKYQKKSIPVQQLANGEMLMIHTYTFIGAESGPTVYLQGNLHGPEIFGTALLIELIEIMKKKKTFKGKIIIVPCANPMGVIQVAYNSMVGRWNPQSGNNWNRIFPINPFTSHEEEKLFYQKVLADKNVSSESRLVGILRTLSSGADYVLDIHTTGSLSAEHLFTYPWMQENFYALNVPVYLSLNPLDSAGAFDESHVLPFLQSLSKEKIPKVATWEVHHHGHIDSAILTKRLAQLVHWLSDIWGEGVHKNIEPKIFTQSEHLYAPLAGYYSWVKNVGEEIKIGETFAVVYQPSTGKKTTVKAGRSCMLLGIYGIGATAAHEQIGWVAYNE